ncbi:GTP-binding protein GEM-like [Tropilaelaps mercedesae]|uniref:small monomeric GTPase n=1 Tax=Tropilaelaps mercedesae TaxID=418985 RepID=A0A1V9WZB1_9ACAR|nr:GTP-binding protein GEM-like [Tropilaelaps mercedesae]
MTPKAKSSRVRISVLGAKGVGKTACITRLMYDKFFHDSHHHGKDVHHRTLGIADESFELEMHEEHKVSRSRVKAAGGLCFAEIFLQVADFIITRAGVAGVKLSNGDLDRERHLELEQCTHTHSVESADALLVVYSIVSRRSFDQAAELVTCFEQRFPDTPLLLVANCCDLNYKREVETEEGREVSSDFVEVSAAQEGSLELQSALETLLRRVAAIRELGQHKRRRSISNVLESIFAWNSRGSFSISV